MSLGLHACFWCSIGKHDKCDHHLMDGHWCECCPPVDVSLLIRTNGEAEEVLRNLLAVIHRDGGQYASEHGLKKAGADAEAEIFKLRARLAAAELGWA